MLFRSCRGCPVRLPCPSTYYCLARRQFIPYSPHVSLYKNVTRGAAAVAGWERDRKALNCAAIPSGSGADLENLAKGRTHATYMTSEREGMKALPSLSALRNLALVQARASNARNTSNMPKVWRVRATLLCICIRSRRGRPR